jgi:hypothetical protein
MTHLPPAWQAYIVFTNRRREAERQAQWWTTFWLTALSVVSFGMGYVVGRWQ